MRLLLRLVLCLGVVTCWGVGARAQGLLANSAAQRISQETSIPQQLIRALFVEDANSQFILAFIYINEQTLQGKLKPEILAAMTPFVNRNALLVLAVPARKSFFDPFAISFVQNGLRTSVDNTIVTPITPDFTTGTLASGAVSAGILALDTRVLVNQAFEVQYNATFSATFELTPAAQGGNATATPSPTAPASNPLPNIFGGFRFLLLNFLFLFLFPFLLV